MSAINIDLSEHEKMRLRGRIDRVDLCETDDKVYVKIIDYKTGNTSLDLVALYYGLQLQLAVYLDAAVELEQKKHPGKLVEPAGVFYYHIDDPILDQEEDETDEAWGRRMLKALRMDGLVNADRKVVELLDRVLADGTTSDVIPTSFHPPILVEKLHHLPICIYKAIHPQCFQHPSAPRLIGLIFFLVEDRIINMIIKYPRRLRTYLDAFSAPAPPPHSDKPPAAAVTHNRAPPGQRMYFPFL